MTWKNRQYSRVEEQKQRHGILVFLHETHRRYIVKRDWHETYAYASSSFVDWDNSETIPFVAFPIHIHNLVSAGHLVVHQGRATYYELTEQGRAEAQLYLRSFMTN